MLLAPEFDFGDPTRPTGGPAEAGQIGPETSHAPPSPLRSLLDQRPRRRQIDRGEGKEGDHRILRFPCSIQTTYRDCRHRQRSRRRAGRASSPALSRSGNRTVAPRPGLVPIGEGYLVAFPNGRKEQIPCEDLFVRWDLPIEGPTGHLAARVNETPFFHEARAGFVRALVEQRAACAGMAGLLSAAIDLENHQIEVVRRVLQDPVQRIARRRSRPRQDDRGGHTDPAICPRPAARSSSFDPGSAASRQTMAG